MADKEYQKYKEAAPEATIQRIKSIMARVGIVPEEKWLRSVEGSVSLRLDFAGTSCGVNGKGTSDAYAQASAYGEAMERVQSGFLPKTSLIDQEAWEYLSFAKAPDEQILSLEELIAQEGALVEELTDNFYAYEGPKSSGVWPGTPLRPEGKSATREALTFWHGINGNSVEGGFICLPFYSLNKGRLEMVPAGLAEIYQGSNGQCAGNTPVEALVQGMSELCERLALKRIIEKRLVLPEIPREYFARHFPRIAALAEEIEALGPFQVKVLDASLGQGLPVISVLFVHQGVHGYRISFGGHPSLAVATERCLTELLQGFSPTSPEHLRWGCLPLDKDSSFDYADYYNLENAQINGTGFLHPEFFAPRGQWDEAAWQRWQLPDNEAMLRALTNTLREMGRDVLIRDNSYLGFPAYTILVPGVGGIAASRRQIKVMGALRWWTRRQQHPEPLTPAECQRLLIALGHNSRSVDRRPILLGISDLEIGAALLKKLGRLAGMASFTQRLAAQADPVTKDYFACLDKWVWLVHRGYDPWPHLQLFFGAELSERIRLEWVEVCPLERLRQAAQAPDPSVSQACSQLRRRLKDAQQANPLDQGRVAEILADIGVSI